MSQDIIAPLIHLNGDRADVLIATLEKAYNACREALHTLRDCAGNARNFSPDPGRWEKYCDQHRERQEHVHAVMASLNAECHAIDDQPEAKRQRRAREGAIIPSQKPGRSNKEKTMPYVRFEGTNAEVTIAGFATYQEAVRQAADDPLERSDALHDLLFWEGLLCDVCSQHLATQRVQDCDNMVCVTCAQTEPQEFAWHWRHRKEMPMRASSPLAEAPLSIGTSFMPKHDQEPGQGLTQENVNQLCDTFKDGVSDIMLAMSDLIGEIAEIRKEHAALVHAIQAIAEAARSLAYR